MTTTWTNNKLVAVQDANGICAHCGRVCRLPWQSLELFVREQSLASEGIAREARGKPRRYQMRVVHLNGRREDDRRENLKPLCLGCAVSYQSRFRRPVYVRRRKYL